ncbi:hypothetical protein M406DRAFT_338624 [Cryphonectria parasitica EP155]|uniref:Uncharacterized protein n=1 Tax=Cryphonectria parasitica (strain ATCC 38755 / EP155) TaxID=660469 RepID=A0A9P4Y7U4_CRYP1|nr:uncharacterized protein M406DRAFT_338624 [Cryphonectria parasitica EP155]KAF3767952.1 hypothetical protein M406DRAFT_338624 [Cryphonectria parasitica EP155]
MTQARTLLGDAHSRFIQVATLLSLIDPHPHDNAGKQEQLVKKFLDSFALICSTSSKGAESASAVCLEVGHPTGTILRLARNLGVSQDLTDGLRDILNDLTAVATKVQEPAILYKIIELTQDKIHSLLQRLCKPEIQKVVDQALEGINGTLFIEDAPGLEFLQWIRNLRTLTSLEPNQDTVRLVPHIRWASEARWVYSEQIELMFCPNGEELPGWVTLIYKLGRYAAAAKALLKLATKQPSLFFSIHVEAIQAPEQERFATSNPDALMTMLKRLSEGNKEQFMSRLGQIWLTDDPELRFRRACRHTLTVHAEMQLLSFYDHHAELTPRLLYMGTSKKACFLCHKFLSRHPLGMSVSASHQKLYPSWMPAPCSISSVRKKHKVLLWELSRHLEQTTVRDLETRLGIRRPWNLDSTAGPSLTTTGSIASDSNPTGFNFIHLSQYFSITTAVVVF